MFVERRFWRTGGRCLCRTENRRRMGREYVREYTHLPGEPAPKKQADW